MCGIVGIAGNMFGREENTMKRLLLIDSLRGMDSTGLASVALGGSHVRLAKKADHCFNLFDTKSFSDALNGTGSLAFIGHNRAATIGARTDVNAHPFMCGDTVGVHNGTLYDDDKKMLEEWVGEAFNTDSEALFTAIDMFGVKEVIPKLQKGRDSYKGAWSLVWWNTKDKRLYFLRNAHRPLWYCFSEDFKLVFWASEFWMLDAAIQKSGGAGYKLYEQQSKDSPEKKFRFFQTKEDVLYTIDAMKLSQGAKERPKFTAVALAGKEPEAAKTSEYPFVTSHSGTHGSVCGIKSHVTPTKSSNKNARKKLTTSSSGEPTAITLKGSLTNPYAGYFTQMGFSFLGQTKNTASDSPQCSWCHKDIPYGQPGIWVATRDNVILCAKCNGHEEVSLLSDYAPATRVLVPRLAFNELR